MLFSLYLTQRLDEEKSFILYFLITSIIMLTVKLSLFIFCMYSSVISFLFSSGVIKQSLISVETALPDAIETALPDAIS